MDYGLPSVGRFSTEWVDFFIVFGAIGLVTLLTFIWALFIRKNGKRRVRRRKHKRRPLNPTLAKSGGLPPLRKAKDPGATQPPP